MPHGRPSIEAGEKDEPFRAVRDHGVGRTPTRGLSDPGGSVIVRRCLAIPLGFLSFLFSYRGRIGLRGMYIRSFIGWFGWPVMLPLGAVITPGSYVGPVVVSLLFFFTVQSSGVVRRLHDLGYSGRRLRPPPAPWLWLDTHLRPGEEQPNKWGPPPRL